MSKKIIYFEAKRGFNYLTGFKELNWNVPNDKLLVQVTKTKQVPTKRCG